MFYTVPKFLILSWIYVCYLCYSIWIFLLLLTNFKNELTDKLVVYIRKDDFNYTNNETII